MNEPPAPCPKYPRTWMQPFLDSFTETGHLANSAKAHLVSPENIYHQVKHHPEFAAAFAMAKARVADRLWHEFTQHSLDAGLIVPPAQVQPPEPPTPSRHLVPIEPHAAAVVAHAHLATLLLLCREVAHAIGIDELDGLSIIAWFNRERCTQLERLIVPIRETDPPLAEQLQRHLAAIEKQTGADFMTFPPGNAPYPSED